MLQKPDELLPQILLPSPLVHNREVLTLFRAIRALDIRLAPHASDLLAQCAIVGPGRRNALPFRERGGEIAQVIVGLAQPDPSLPVLRLELHSPTKRLDRFPRVPLPKLQVAETHPGGHLSRIGVQRGSILDLRLRETSGLCQAVRHHRAYSGQVSPDRRVTRVQSRRPHQEFKRRLGVSPSDLGDCRLVQAVRFRVGRLRRKDEPSGEEHANENPAGPHPNALHNEGTAHAVRWPEVLAVAAGERLERETGFEPATPSLEGSRSSQLSYSRLPVTLHALALKTTRATLHWAPVCPETRPRVPPLPSVYMVGRGGFEPPKA